MLSRRGASVMVIGHSDHKLSPVNFGVQMGGPRNIFCFIGLISTSVTTMSSSYNPGIILVLFTRPG